jgi:hypothetical protein
LYGVIPSPGVIALPAGWRVVHSLDSLELVHPGGEQVAVIEYRECVRPLERAGALVRRALAHMPTFSWRELPDTVERLVTFEGEYAALATVAGTHDGAPAQADIGFVFGDDYYAQTSALCFRSDERDHMTALVRRLVTGDSHVLGVRRRRFEYNPPSGWQPMIRRYITEWLPPGFPNDALHLTVYPATPKRLERAELARVFLGNSTIEHERTGPLALSSGLAGDWFEASYTRAGERFTRLAAILDDDRYTYALEAIAIGDGPLAAHRDELDRVFASVQPIPKEHDAETALYIAWLAHWAD